MLASLPFSYKIYIPGGNDTALVFGLEPDADRRRSMQEQIMRRHPNVEQVGFISEDASAPQLVMTGGEFCGNATRAAVWHYLGGKPGRLSIRVSGASEPLEAGVSETLHAWTQMPVYASPDKVTAVGDGLYWVEMEGIAHLVVSQRRSRPLLQDEPEALLASAKALLRQLALFDNPACGVMFTETVLNLLKIHPCVFINTAGTAYYETACGSGSVAVGLAAAVLRAGDVDLPLLQPSGKVIQTFVGFQGGQVRDARISGVVSE